MKHNNVPDIYQERLNMQGYQGDPFDDTFVAPENPNDIGEEWIPIHIPVQYCRKDATHFPCKLSNFGIVSFAICSGLASLAFVWCLKKRIQSYPRGNDRMNAIADKIASGAKAFLWIQYRYLAVFTAIVYALLLAFYTIDHPTTDRDAKDGARYSSAFLFGAVMSALAGYQSMLTATETNVRTAQAAAAEQGALAEALHVAFSGGAVTGFTVVGLGLAGLSTMYWLLTLGYQHERTDTDVRLEAATALTGFGFGASSIALFARVAGGIYTKAADVGADLVGKLELDIPEDDARNPAVIADLVGDNVGDVAGMGADLLESMVGSIIAAVSLADGSVPTVMLPFWIAGAGIIASMIGYFGVATPRGASQKQLLRALRRGIFLASFMAIIFFAVIVYLVFMRHETYGRSVLACIVLGLVSGFLIGLCTEYFTSYDYWPVKSIAASGATGPATVVIQGMGIGMLSTVIPALLLVATILACHSLAGSYGIAMSAVGMLSTLGVTLATDAYGPIADNAGGIAEMAHLDHRVRETTDALDSVGNTTAATGKGFAIGSAVLTALSLVAAFKQRAGVDVVDVGDPVVLSGILIGSILPFLFAALTLLSVQKTAAAIIVEVRWQFTQHPGLRNGTTEADSDRCIAIAAAASVHEMILPGLYAVLSPVTVGFLIGPRCLTGLLGGAIASGMMLAIMMANAGGAWDNAKKYIEIEGASGGKGTTIHKACVVGDTVGDPFKDTAGPSLNILIKLMSIISLVVAPLLQIYDSDFQYWYYGMIPLVLLILASLVVYRLFWKDQVLADLAKKDDDLRTDDDAEEDGEADELQVLNKAEFA